MRSWGKNSQYRFRRNRPLEALLFVLRWNAAITILRTENAADCTPSRPSKAWHHRGILSTNKTDKPKIRSNEMSNLNKMRNKNRIMKYYFSVLAAGASPLKRLGRGLNKFSCSNSQEMANFNIQPSNRHGVFCPRNPRSPALQEPIHRSAVRAPVRPLRVTAGKRVPVAEAANCAGPSPKNPCASIGPDQPDLSRGIGNGGGWIRTNVGVRQRIYSPSPLATRAPLRERAALYCQTPDLVNDTPQRAVPADGLGLQAIPAAGPHFGRQRMARRSPSDARAGLAQAVATPRCRARQRPAGQPRWSPL